MIEPVAMSTVELHALLVDMTQRIEMRDSMDGSISYSAHDGPRCTNGCDQGTFDDKVCKHCRGWGVEPLPRGTDFWVHGLYRVGNSEGQGGMRIIGGVVPNTPTV